MKISYNNILAEKMKAQGIALTLSGAYVHRSFDEAELANLVKLAQEPIEFEKELRVVTAKGRGCLVREARLSLDGSLVRYIGGIMSLKLLGGEALRHHEFANRLAGLPGIKIQHQTSGEKKVGVLLGSLDDLYATLVDTANGKLRFTDIETQERANNRHVVVKKVPLAEGDAEKLEEVRRQIAAIAATKNQDALETPKVKSVK